MREDKKPIRLPVLNGRDAKAYVTAADGKALFPNGAAIVNCRYCGVSLLTRADEPDDDCGTHGGKRS